MVGGDRRGRVVGGTRRRRARRSRDRRARRRPRAPSGRRRPRTSRRRAGAVAPTSALGSATSGCTAARRGCGASTSRPSEPETWATTASAGLDARRDRLDVLVRARRSAPGRRRGRHSGTAGSRPATVSTSQPTSRSASANEPPARPRPTTRTCRDPAGRRRRTRSAAVAERFDRPHPTVGQIDVAMARPGRAPGRAAARARTCDPSSGGAGSSGSVRSARPRPSRRCRRRASAGPTARPAPGRRPPRSGGTRRAAPCGVEVGVELDHDVQVRALRAGRRPDRSRTPATPRRRRAASRSRVAQVRTPVAEVRARG